MAKVKSTETSFDFEKSLAKLDQIVEQMEQGGLSLEDSLKSFEEGIALARACSVALKTAEQKVQILLEQNGSATLAPFNELADDN